MAASIEGNKHLQDGTIKSKLIQSYSCMGNFIASSFESGEKTFDEAMSAIDNEFDEIKKQSLAIANKYSDPVTKGLGLAAGIIQTIGGGVGAYFTCGTSLVSDLMFLNGLTNIYENGIYFITGDTETEGFMRSLYQLLARGLGESKDEAKYAGSFVYSVTDLVLSGVGLFGLSKDVKLLNSDVFSGFKTFKLYHAFDEELLKGYQAMAKPLLLLESYSDYGTAGSSLDSYNNLRKSDGKQPITMDTMIKEIVKKAKAQGVQ